MHWSRRLFAAWLALSVVFVLAPCCDAQAALPSGSTHAAPDHAAASHDHGGGDEPPCAAWLDRNDALPVESGVLPTAPPTLALPATSIFPLLPVSFAAVRRSFAVPASPPDALYLRYLRLIL